MKTKKPINLLPFISNAILLLALIAVMVFSRIVSHLFFRLVYQSLLLEIIIFLWLPSIFLVFPFRSLERYRPARFIFYFPILNFVLLSESLSESITGLIGMRMRGTSASKPERRVSWQTKQ